MTEGRVNKILAAIIFTVMLVIYVQTVAPTLSFWDCGEFIATSFIMGIPHPPGSPMLSIIGRVMSLVPFSDFRGSGVTEIAYRVNLLDVLLGALTVMLTYLVMVQLIRRFRPSTGSKIEAAIVFFSAMVTAFMVGFADEFWNNAIETETYMPSLFLSMVALWLTLRWAERNRDPKTVLNLFLAAYLIGLGNGIHLSVLLIAPTVFLIVLFTRPDWF
ncbi:MAG: glycosyltransferase family 117 protein, partial [Candidatus Latescibacterota bacterium]